MSENADFSIPQSPFRCVGYLYPVWNFFVVRPLSDEDSESNVRWSFQAGARLSEIGEDYLRGVGSVRLSTVRDTEELNQGQKPYFVLDVEVLGDFMLSTENEPTLEDLDRFAKMVRVNGLTYLVSALRPAVRDFLLKASRFEAVVPGLNVASLKDDMVSAAFRATWDRLKAEADGLE